jgi:hypothetical protein
LETRTASCAGILRAIRAGLAGQVRRLGGLMEGGG